MLGFFETFGNIMMAAIGEKARDAYGGTYPHLRAQIFDKLVNTIENIFEKFHHMAAIGKSRICG